MLTPTNDEPTHENPDPHVPPPPPVMVSDAADERSLSDYALAGGPEEPAR